MSRHSLVGLHCHRPNHRLRLRVDLTAPRDRSTELLKRLIPQVVDSWVWVWQAAVVAQLVRSLALKGNTSQDQQLHHVMQLRNRGHSFEKNHFNALLARKTYITTIPYKNGFTNNSFCWHRLWSGYRLRLMRLVVTGTCSWLRRLAWQTKKFTHFDKLMSTLMDESHICKSSLTQI